MRPSNAFFLTLLLPLAALFASCASTGGDSGQEARSPGTPADPSTGEQAAPEGAEDLRRALAEAARRPGSWSELHLAVECHGKDAPRTLEVFGSGVAVWNNRRQFELPASEVAHLLGLLEEADFPGMRPEYGGKKKPPGVGEPNPGNAAIITCRIQLDLDGLKKESSQLYKGEQSEALKGLANAVLDLCQEPGEAGVTAADLREGLEKISSGELAPEVLTLILHRKPDKRSAGGEGFLLRVAGPRVSTRTFDPSEGYGETLEMRLDPAELRELAQALADGDPAGFPANLWAEDYTDLSIQVLDKRKSVQARQFARLSPSTHGQIQVNFDSVYAALLALHQRILSDGLATGGDG